jgi:alkylated DNA repair dioxygenase AlkB
MFSQLNLFTENASTTAVPAILGLAYLPDYITPAQEQTLLQHIDAAPWRADLKRQVQHYGYKYDYKAKRVGREAWLGPLPEWLAGYCVELQECGLFPRVPDQVIINEYLPGQGITPHIDCVPCFGDTIASLSLGSACIMEFTHSKPAEKLPMLLKPRSLVILSGEARYRWQHSIPQRKTDRWGGSVLQRGRRVSLTFRTVISG